MHPALEIIKQAEAEADKIAREFHGLPTVTCPRCKGTDRYRPAEFNSGPCPRCLGGKVPTDRKAWISFKVDRELRRLRRIWVGYRDALRSNPPKRIADDAVVFMERLEQRAAAIKANPRMLEH